MNESVENAGSEDSGSVVGMPEQDQQPNQESSQVVSDQETPAEASPQSDVSQEATPQETTELQDGQWLLKEGVLGAGDRPPFLLEKYGYNMETQAKAMPDAQRKIGEQNQRLGAFTGAPDKYDFSTVEDDDFKFDTQDKVFNEFVTECQNNNISQDFAVKLAGFAKQMTMQPAANLQEEVKNYGASYNSDIKHISNWIGNNVENADDATNLTNSIQSAGALRALKVLMNTNGFTLPGNEIPTAPLETLKDVQSEFSANLYSGENIAENPEKALKWVEKFNKHSGSKKR